MLNEQAWQILNSSIPGKKFFDSKPQAEPAGRKQSQITVLFADIVGSTELAVAMGDDCWARVIKKYYALAKKHLNFFGGHLLSTTGDGFIASFEYSVVAARCASAIRESVNALGLAIRIGLHSGPCLKIGRKLVGLTFHIGARIAAAACVNEVLLSDSIKIALEGSGVNPVESGTYSLKGLPGEWPLFSLPTEDTDQN